MHIYLNYEIYNNKLKNLLFLSYFIQYNEFKIKILILIVNKNCIIAYFKTCKLCIRTFGFLYHFLKIILVCSTCVCNAIMSFVRNFDILNILCNQQFVQRNIIYHHNVMYETWMRVVRVSHTIFQSDTSYMPYFNIRVRAAGGPLLLYTFMCGCRRFLIQQSLSWLF